MALRMVLRMRALLAAVRKGSAIRSWNTHIGDSPFSIAWSRESLSSLALVILKGPIHPTVPTMRGNQLLLAAATVIRPATKELPRAEPAMTRQIRIVAKYATPLPRKCVTAVYQGLVYAITKGIVVYLPRQQRL
jgi:hypothetical protein